MEIENIYLRLSDFISSLNLPKIFKSKNNDFYYFLRKDIDFNSNFYISLILSAFLALILLFISFLFLFFGYRSVLLLFFDFFAPVIFFYFCISFFPEKFKSAIKEDISRSSLLFAVFVSYLSFNSNVEVAIKKTFSGNEIVSGVFSRILKDSMLGKNIKSGIMEASSKIEKFSYGLKRCIVLAYRAVSEKDLSKRAYSLDKALSIFLKDTEINLVNFGQKILSYSVVIFAFGVVVPLVFISLFPISSMFSSFSNDIIIPVMILSLALVWILSNQILSSKPIIFARSYANRESSKNNIALVSAIIFIVLSSPSIFFALERFKFAYFSDFSPVFEAAGFLPLCIAASVSLSFYFYFSSKKDIDSIKKAEKLENGVYDVIYSIASDIDEGIPLESSIKKISSGNNAISSDISKVHRLTSRGVSVKDSFSKVFADSESFLVRKVFAFISEASIHGSKVTSTSLFDFAEHLSELKRITDDSKAKLNHTLSMMQISVVFLAPIICGIAVVLNSVISLSALSINSDLSVSGFAPGFVGLSFAAVDPYFLSAGVFFYLILFSAVCSRFIVYAQNGRIFSVLKLELSKILLIVTSLYLITLLAGQQLLGALQ